MRSHLDARNIASTSRRAKITLSPRLIEIALTRDASNLMDAKNFALWKDLVYDALDAKGLGLIEHVRRTPFQKTLVLSGLLSLLRADNGEDALKSVIEKDGPGEHVLDDKLSQEVAQLTCLVHIDHHGVEKAVEARKFFQNTATDLHSALKLFPTGASIMKCLP